MIMPHDLKAEQAVLGSIILNNNVIDMVSPILSESSFHVREHRIIFKAMLKLSEEKAPIDEITIGEMVKDKLDDLGGYAFIAELPETVPTTGNPVYYAKIIKENETLRDLIKIGDNIKQSCQGTDHSLADIIQEAQTSVDKLFGREVSKDRFTIKEASTSLIERLETAVDGKIETFNTGIRSIDKVVSIEAPELVIIAGRPSMGKTSLATIIALNISAKYYDKNVLIYSLETTKEMVAEKMHMQNKKIDGNKMRHPKDMDQESWDKLSMSIDELSGRNNIVINDSSDMSVNMVCADAIAENNRQRVSMIVIDYLQLMDPPKDGWNKEDQVAKMCRKIKMLGKKLNVPVLLLSQLSRQVENRSPPEPVMSDLRDSGSIEQDADIIFLLYRDEVYNPIDTKFPGEAKIIIAKNKRGRTGYVMTGWEGKTNRFYDL